MSKISEELALAKQKRDAFKEAERVKKETVVKKINDMKSSMDEFCQVFTSELQAQSSQFGMKITGPFTKTWQGSRPDDLPNRDWRVEYDGFKESQISAMLQSPSEIRLFGGGYDHRVVVYALRDEGGWRFEEVPYEARTDHSKIPAEKITKLETIKEAVESILADVIFSMGNESVKE